MPPWPRTLLEVPLLPRWAPQSPVAVDGGGEKAAPWLLPVRLAARRRRAPAAVKSGEIVVPHVPCERANDHVRSTSTCSRFGSSSTCSPPLWSDEIRLDWGYAISIRPALLHLLNKCSGVKKINYGGLFCLALCLQCAILPFLMPISMDR